MTTTPVAARTRLDLDQVDAVVGDGQGVGISELTLERDELEVGQHVEQLAVGGRDRDQARVSPPRPSLLTMIAPRLSSIAPRTALFPSVRPSPTRSGLGHRRPRSGASLRQIDRAFWMVNVHRTRCYPQEGQARALRLKQGGYCVALILDCSASTSLRFVLFPPERSAMRLLRAPLAVLAATLVCLALLVTSPTRSEAAPVAASVGPADCTVLQSAPQPTTETQATIPTTGAFFPDTNGLGGDLAVFGADWSDKAAGNRRWMAVDMAPISAPQSGSPRFSVPLRTSDWGKPDGSPIPYRFDDDDEYVHVTGWPATGDRSDSYLLATPNLRRPSPYFEPNTTAEQKASTEATDPPIRKQPPWLIAQDVAPDGTTALTVVDEDQGDALPWSVFLASTGSPVRVPIDGVSGAPIAAGNRYFIMGTAPSGSSRLLQVDPATAAVSDVPNTLPTGRWFLTDATPDAHYLVVAVGTGRDRQWFRVDPTTGATIGLSLDNSGTLLTLQSRGRISDDGRYFAFSPAGFQRSWFLRDVVAGTTTSVPSGIKSPNTDPVPLVSTDGRYFSWSDPTQANATMFWDRTNGTAFTAPGEFGYQNFQITAWAGKYWAVVFRGSHGPRAIELTQFSDPRSCGAAPAKPRISILGDSYIAGEGVGTYLPGTDVGGNKCHRSIESWAYQVALQVTDPSSISFVACSGAVADNLDDPTKVQYNEPASQLDQMNDPDVVLLSLGGNDALFRDVIISCMLGDCLSTGWANTIFGTDVQSAFESLPRLAAIRAKIVLDEIKAKAPRATIIMMGYPSAVIDQTECPASDAGQWASAIAERSGVPESIITSSLLVTGGGKLSSTEQKWANEKFLTDLNFELKRAATEAGVWFVDPQNWFASHGICSPTSPYAHGIALGDDILSFLGNESFHPTLAGYREMTTRASSLIVGSGLINQPNPVPIATGLTVSVPKDTLTVTNSALGTNIWASPGAKVAVNQTADGPVFTTQFSVPVAVGTAVPSSPGGAAETHLTVPVGTPAGFHTMTVRDSQGRLLWMQPVLVNVPDQCRAATGQPDVDDDGVGDWCDPMPDDGPLSDPDHDGLRNLEDNCPVTSNPDQAPGSGSYGVACDPLRVNVAEVRLPASPVPSEPDGDDDGVSLEVDNCPLVANPDQRDTDNDRIGDMCEGDTIAPTVLGTPAQAPNGNGWLNTPTSINWIATDAEPSAGFVGPAPTSTAVDEQGTVAYQSADACDAVGNCGRGTLSLSLDSTPPSVRLVAPTDGTTIPLAQYSPPTCSSTDALSGLDGACTVTLVGPTPVPVGVRYTATATSSDKAGNVANATSTFTVITDQMPPSIQPSFDRPANAAGWWNAPLTVTFACTDDSAVAECPGPATVATDGANQSVTVTARDIAGNQGTLTVSGINIDTIRPTLTVSGGPQAGGQYPFGAVPPEPACLAQDTGSGPNGCTISGYSTVLGPHTVTFTASDVAGNTTTQTAPYSVGTDQFAGFQAPLPKTKPASSNSTIPVKFALLDYLGKTPVTTATARVIITASAADQSSPLGTATCTYSVVNNAYQCNLKIPVGVAGNGTYYYLTVQEQVGGAWVTIPNAKAVTHPNIQPIVFK